jgi:HlyD family secretion protein
LSTKRDNVAAFAAQSPPLRDPMHAVGSGMDRRIVRKRPRWLIPLVGAGAAIVAAATVGYALMPAKDTLYVARGATSVATVQLASFKDEMPLRAEVAPLLTVFLTAVQGGQVTEVSGNDGTLVRQGDVLARLTNPQFQIGIANQEAEIISKLGDNSAQRIALQRGRLAAEQEAATAQQAAFEADDELAKGRTLHQSGLIADARLAVLESRAAFQHRRASALSSAAENEKASVERQRSRLEESETRLRSNLDVVRSASDALTIRAPASGRLTDFKLKPGQTVAPGEAIGQIDSEGEYKLVGAADEYYLGRIVVGQKAFVTLGASVVELGVTKVDPQVVKGRFTVELGIRGEAPSDLKRGQAADATVKLGDTRPALVLPNGAWARGSGTTSVFILDGQNKATKKSVEIGRTSPGQVEILSGLNAGDAAIVSDTAPYAKYTTIILR